jgi:hypothetical protein
MGNLFSLFSGIAFIYLFILVPLLLLMVASLQKRVLRGIAARFMGLTLTGHILRACLAGLVGGTIASLILSAFGGQLASLAVFLLASWPFLFLWVRKQDAEATGLTHREAAILSAASTFIALILLYVIGYLVSVAVALGLFAVFA